MVPQPAQNLDPAVASMPQPGHFRAACVPQPAQNREPANSVALQDAQVAAGAPGALPHPGQNFAPAVMAVEQFAHVAGPVRMVDATCMASVGAVSNPDHMNEVIGKAGRNRWKGQRPISRGIARNPVDHPNGGRTNGGKHWATPWGKPTKGTKTRSNKRTQKFIVRSRHDRKKSQ